ncbi:hypothetical protein V5O48_016537, partial [Marasmius crinis-equi]
FYRKHIGAYLGKCRQGSRVEKILVLLIESGVDYPLIYISRLVGMVRAPLSPHFAGKVAQQGFNGATMQLTGTYLTLLIVLIHFQRSMWDTSGISSIVFFSKTSQYDVIEPTERSSVPARNYQEDGA